MAKTATQLIWLNLAFAKVLGSLEDADGVPIAARLGYIDGNESGADDCALPRIPATGSQFKEEFTSVPQPKRGGGTWPATEPRVPAVPDCHQLSVMLGDDLQARISTSAAERRACRAHQRLLECLSSGQIKAWAEEWIGRQGSSPGRMTHSSRPIDPEWWRDCSINYFASTVRPTGEWEARLEGHRITGPMLLKDVALDELALESTLKIAAVEAELARTITSEMEKWTIIWNGRPIEIDCTKQPARSRAMHAIEMLLRNPKRPISCCLLAGLNRRKVDQGAADPSDTEVSRVRSLIDPTSRDLFEGKIALDQAEQNVLNHVATLDGSESKSSTRFLQMEYDLVYNSLKGLKDYLWGLKAHVREDGQSLSSDVAKFLQRTVRYRAGRYRYQPDDAAVTWRWRRESTEKS